MATRTVDVVELIAQEQIDELRSDPTPDPSQVPAWRPATAKHYFRTDPGHRRPSIRIPGVNAEYPQDRGREDGKEPTKAFYQRLDEKKYSKEQRAIHEAVREANNGERYIAFQHIPNKFEAFLETDSDVLADYIRSLIASGELPNVYEDSRVPTAGTPTMPPHRAVAAMRLQQAQDVAGA